MVSVIHHLGLVPRSRLEPTSATAIVGQTSTPTCTDIIRCQDPDFAWQKDGVADMVSEKIRKKVYILLLGECLCSC